MPHGYATMSVASILAETAHRMPDNVALIFNGQEIAYRDLWDQTRSYAGALRDLGVGPGDKVALMIPNVPDFPRAYYGVLALGAVVVPIHALLKATEIEYVLRDSGSKVLICAAPLLTEGAKGTWSSSCRSRGWRTWRRARSPSRRTFPVIRSTPRRSSTRAARPESRKGRRAVTSRSSSR